MIARSSLARSIRNGRLCDGPELFEDIGIVTSAIVQDWRALSVQPKVLYWFVSAIVFRCTAQDAPKVLQLADKNVRGVSEVMLAAVQIHGRFLKLDMFAAHWTESWPAVLDLPAAIQHVDDVSRGGAVSLLPEWSRMA